MGDDAIRPEPKPSGCLKWSCGCVALAALSCAALLFAGWYFLSRWTPGGSAWEHLPPDTLFAVEAHDVSGLMRTAAGDPGAVSLMAAVLGRYQAYMAEHKIPVNPDLPQAVYEIGAGAAWLHTLAFPNYILFGARGRDAAGAFMIVQPPRWFAWTAAAVLTEGKAEIITDGETTFYIARRDGFVIAGLNEATVRHVCDNWESGGETLGAEAGRKDPFVMFAARAGAEDAAEETARRGGGAGDAAGPFLSGGLTGNFAPPPEAAAAGELPSIRVQALIHAAEGGWSVRFEAVDAAMPVAPGTFTDQIMKKTGEGTPGVVLPDRSDLELALRLPADLMRRVTERFTDTLDGRLRRGLLDRAGGMFTLLASRPAEPEPEAESEEAGAPPYPPLPVTSLGWNLGSTLAPLPFAAMLTEAVDSLRAPEGPLPEAVADAVVTVERAEDKLSGTVTVPPVLANGARPAWKFLLNTVPGMGWMATDPSGLPEPALIPRLALQTLPAPAEGHAAAAANWDMSRVFIDAAAAVAADRLAQLPDGWFEEIPGGKKDAASFVRLARGLFTAYPRGTLEADVDADRGEAKGRVFIPFGMSVDIE